MSGCTATIRLDFAEPTVSTCTYPDADHDSGLGGPHYCASSKVTWWDSSPGATPHDPGPHYRVEQWATRWVVERVAIGSPARVVASFHDVHPDPKGAAEAHADWLGNPEAFAGDADYFDVSQERDRYRKALEQIAGGRWNVNRGRTETAPTYARRTLEGTP